MYHRVAEHKPDPWQLCVTPVNFEEHIKYLSSNDYTFLSVPELQQQHNSGKIKSRSVCLTFDDGYRDNFQTAVPILKKYNAKACFFICPGFIGKETNFWWDDLLNITLKTEILPSSISIDFPSEKFSRAVESIKMSDQAKHLHEQWKWPAPPPTSRTELYLALWERLRSLPYLQIDECMKQIKSWAGANEEETELGYPMSLEELKMLASDPLFDIGIHTNTHPVLSHHHPAYQRTEISASLEQLKAWVPTTLEAIAYPYGNFNEQTLEVATALGLQSGFTTKEESVTPKSVPLQIGRFHVKNLDSKAFATDIFNWSHYYN